MVKGLVHKKPAGKVAEQDDDDQSKEDKEDIQSLTAENLSKLGTVDLLERFKQGNITGEDLLNNLSPAETQKLWKRFEYARKGAGDDVQESWDSLDKIPRGGQKQTK